MMTPMEVDEARLRQMLDLVGPDSEARLLKSLVGDLATARTELAKALAKDDVAAVCAQSHVLSSLAGTFGAPGLAIAARALERQACSSGPTANGTEVLALIDRLAQQLSARILPQPVRAP